MLRLVEMVRGGANGGRVALWPTLTGEPAVVRLGLDQVLFGGAPLLHRVGEPGSRGSSFGVSIAGYRGVEPGDLIGEPLVGDAQGFDAERERVVGSAAGEGDGGPVVLEPLDTGGDGVATPSFALLEVVMEVLVVFEPFDSAFGLGQAAGGVDYGLLVGAESVFELTTFGACGPAEASERSKAVETGTGLAEPPLRTFEVVVNDGESVVGYGELTGAVGSLAIEDCVVAQMVSRICRSSGHGSSTAAMVVSGTRARQTATCWALRWSASRPPWSPSSTGVVF
jgi:hypothetical protein